MSDASAVVLAVGVCVIIAAIVGFVVASDRRAGREPLPPVCRPRLWTHAAPPRPFTVAQAVKAWEQHRVCAPASCPRREHALEILSGAGYFQRTVGAR